MDPKKVGNSVVEHVCGLVFLCVWYLLPGVEFEGGSTDLLDLLVSGSEQQIPVRSGGLGHLERRIAKLNTTGDLTSIYKQ